MVSVAFSPTPTISTTEEGSGTETLYGNSKRAQAKMITQERPIISRTRRHGKHIIFPLVTCSLWDVCEASLAACRE